MKKLTILLLLPSVMLAYQPAVRAPEILLVTHRPEPQPTEVIAVVPAVVIGAVVIGGLAWAGLKVANRIINIWERKVTNSPPAGVVFTLQGSFEGEESGQ